MASPAWLLGKATPIALGGFVLMAIGYGLKVCVEKRFPGAELREAAYAGYRGRGPMLIPLGPVEKS